MWCRASGWNVTKGNNLRLEMNKARLVDSSVTFEDSQERSMETPGEVWGGECEAE